MTVYATIEIRRGLKSALPSSGSLGEPFFCTDTGELFVWNGIAMVQIVGSGDGDIAESNVIGLVADLAAKANTSSLAPVATSGVYADLTGKPSIPTLPISESNVTNLTSDLAAKANSSSLATVATSGAYADLSGKPSLATVATSGAYPDLTSKPTLAATKAGVSSNWLASYDSATGLFTASQPAESDIPNLVSDLAGKAVLAVAPFFTIPVGTGSGATSAANKAALWGFYLPYPVLFSTFTYQINTADNSANLYALGLYNSAGTLVAHTGPTAGTTFAPSTGTKSIATVEGSQTIPAGRYYWAFSSVTATAKLAGTTGIFIPVVDTTSFTTSGAVLITPITPPADSWTAATMPSLVLR